MSERESFLRAFHDAQPGITSRALARAGSYERLAARVFETLQRAPGSSSLTAPRVLDLACGDGELLAWLGPGAVGVDMSRGEVARARARDTSTCTMLTGRAQQLPFADEHCASPVVLARAQELPFADASFDVAACHLAFMLFDDIERVVAELARVLRPGAPFVALLGGGPAADATDDTDAFHCFVTSLRDSASLRGHGFGDRRASSEAGWTELFGIDTETTPRDRSQPDGWRDLAFERWPLDLAGSFDDVWRFLGASYQLPADQTERIRSELRAAFPGDIVPCTVVTYLATVTR